jgi:hypothetical protein
MVIGWICAGILASSSATGSFGHVRSDLSLQAPGRAAAAPDEPGHGTPTLLGTGLTPLTPTQRAVFLRPRADPPPEVFGGVTEARHGQHYVTGNEQTLDAFHAAIDGLGGGYLGVGAEQGYLLIGLSRAELAWLVDYDPAVVDMHAVHQTLMAAAATPEEFLALWHRPQRDAALALLRVADRGDGRRVELYRQYRSRVARRLDEIAARMLTAGVPSFLTDAADYAHVRGLLAAGRVRALTADLTQRGALPQIARASRELGVPLRVVYLSNAEEYWERLSPEFRANLRGLPVDDSSLVLRTLLSWEKNRDYRYNAQPARLYRRWLAYPEVRSIYDVIRRATVVTDARGFFASHELPDPALLRRRERRRLAEEAAEEAALATAAQ